MAKRMYDLATTQFSNWPEFLTPSEVGDLFRVDQKTVRVWADKGKIPYIRTLGGHRRFPKQAVHDLFNRE